MGSCIHIQPVHADSIEHEQHKAAQCELPQLDVSDCKCQSSQTTNSSESSIIGMDEECRRRHSIPSHSLPSRALHMHTNMTKNLNSPMPLEVISDDHNDKIYADEALDAIKSNEMPQIITNGKEEYESDDTKHEHSDEVNESDEDDLDEPSPSNSPQQQSSKQEQITNAVEMDLNAESLSIKQLSDINFKCIQSAHATQAGLFHKMLP